MDSLQTFMSKLDSIVEEYNTLLSIHQDKEFLIRSIQSIEKKYTQKIHNLEYKLKIAKTKWLKAEEDKKKLSESLKLLTQSDKPGTSSSCGSATSDENFVTPLSEDILEESNIIEWRKHNPLNSSTAYITKPNVSSNLKIHSANKTCPVKCKRSPDLSYLGVTRLEEKSCDKKLFLHSTAVSSISKTPENPRQSEKKLFETFVLTPICNRDLNTRNITSVGQMVGNDLIDAFHSISKFAPLIPPMIPALVIHCVNEVEKRGLREIGIYRMPAVQEDMDLLREKFANLENLDLSDINVHSVAAFLKNFLLNNPLIPQPFHGSFTKTAENNIDRLYYSISLLPQANRDTLAYIIIHLRRIIASPSTRMNSDKISAIFSPIIFGLEENEKENLITIMELLKLPGKYWSSFIIEPPASDTPGKLRNSPSTERLVRKKKYFTPPNPNKKRFFPSPLEKVDELKTKLTILNLYFHELEELMDSINDINETYTFKSILNEIKTVIITVESDLSSITSADDSDYDTLNTNNSTMTDTFNQNESKKRDFSKTFISDEEIMSENETQLNTVNQLCTIGFLKSQNGNTTLERKNLIQSNLERFFAKYETESRNSVKRIKLQTAIQMTPIKNNNSQKTQPMFQEITRVFYSPVVYDILRQKANQNQLDVLKKCQQMKQAICKETLEANVGDQKKVKEENAEVQVVNRMKTESTTQIYNQYETSTMEMREKPPLLPAQRPSWRWDPEEPTAIAEFKFWDEKNQAVVYCCRACFRIFFHWVSRCNHEKKLNLDRKAHFEFYTSHYYLKTKRKTRRSRY